MSHYIGIPISRIRLQIGVGIYAVPTADTVTKESQLLKCYNSTSAETISLRYLSSARPMVCKDDVGPT